MQEAVIHLDRLGAKGVVAFQYIAINYTDLTTVVAPTANEGDLAIVYNSQGVWLINRKLKGTYIYQSDSWQYVNQEIQDRLKPLFTIKSVNYSALNGDFVDMTTGVTNKTITFPASPSVDDLIVVTKADSGLGTIIINGNGKLINGNATDIIQYKYTVMSYQYNGAEWRKF